MFWFSASCVNPFLTPPRCTSSPWSNRTHSDENRYTTCNPLFFGIHYSQGRFFVVIRGLKYSQSTSPALFLSLILPQVFAQFSGSIMGVHFLAPTELRSTRSPNPTCSHLPRSDKKMNVMKTRSRATEIGSSTPTALDPKLRVNGSSQLAPAGSTIVPTDDGNGN